MPSRYDDDANRVLGDVQIKIKLPSQRGESWGWGLAGRGGYVDRES